jgi:hypothetical protein
MIIELQKVDIFAHLGAYLLAREFVQDKGYRVCIDGLTHKRIDMVDRERLGADLAKLVGHSVGIKMFQGHFVENLTAEYGRRRELLRLKRRMERAEENPEFSEEYD